MTKLFVPVVDALRRGVVAKVVDQVADIVQQAGGDQRGAVTGLLGEPSRLQRVRPLIDPGQSIGPMSLALDDRAE